MVNPMVPRYMDSVHLPPMGYLWTTEFYGDSYDPLLYGPHTPSS